MGDVLIEAGSPTCFWRVSVVEGSVRGGEQRRQVAVCHYDLVSFAHKDHDFDKSEWLRRTQSALP